LLSPSVGSVESLQPVNATPPDLRDEMCGPHRKRPAAEEADDEGEPASFLMSGLPPSGIKPSSLLKDRPDGMKTIAVFIGSAKGAAEAQFSAARAKLAKTQSKKPATADAPAAAAAPAAPASTLQTVSAPPAGAFTPTQTQQRAARSPTANNGGSSPMSFAPAAKTDPVPLTAMPDAKPAAAPAKKPAATANKPATAANKPAAAASKPAAAKAATPAQPKDKAADKKTDKKVEKKKSDDKKDPNAATKKPAKSAATGAAGGTTTARP